MLSGPGNPGAARQVVHIIDDDESICEGLLNLLESVGLEAAWYASAEAFRPVLRGPISGCILLDARLPGISGPDFQDELARTNGSLPIIFMTAHGDMPMVRKVLKSGAVEFLFKPFQKEELLQAVRQAFALERQRREDSETQRNIKARIGSLSDRERQVMAMVTAGLLNKQIASELQLSEIMVKIHRRNVMEGMEANSLADLVKMCERAKFPSWEPDADSNL